MASDESQRDALVRVCEALGQLGTAGHMREVWCRAVGVADSRLDALLWGAGGQRAAAEHAEDGALAFLLTYLTPDLRQITFTPTASGELSKEDQRLLELLKVGHDVQCFSTAGAGEKKQLASYGPKRGARRWRIDLHAVARGLQASANRPAGGHGGTAYEVKTVEDTCVFLVQAANSPESSPALIQPVEKTLAGLWPADPGGGLFLLSDVCVIANGRLGLREDSTLYAALQSAGSEAGNAQVESVEALGNALADLRNRVERIETADLEDAMDGDAPSIDALSDQDLWHILQMSPPAKPTAGPWEQDYGPGVGRAWVDWAKGEILSGGECCGSGGVDLLQCCVYLARMIRILVVLAENSISCPASLRVDTGSAYEEGYLNGLLVNGLEACGCPPGKTDDVFWLAKRDGFLLEEESDDWRPGMRSGSGIRKYYGLTFKGRKRAEAASVMPGISDDSDGAARQDEGAEEPDTRADIPEMSQEERQNASLILLLLLAQAYYKMLECAVTAMCGAVDLNLNQSYLWVVSSIQNLLKNEDTLADFPGEFKPVFEDLFPSTIRDLDWEDMIAPEAEGFLSEVQRYVCTKGTHDPEEGSPGWAFIELFRPGVNKAIERAIEYQKRMRQYVDKSIEKLKAQGFGQAGEGESGENGRKADGASAILTDAFERVFLERCQRHGCTGEFRVVGAKIVFEESGKKLLPADFDLKKHRAEARGIADAFAKVPAEIDRGELSVADMSAVLKRATDWQWFAEPEERHVLRVVVERLEAALGVPDPDFADLPAAVRDECVQDAVRASLTRLFGHAPTRRELYAELAVTQVDAETIAPTEEDFAILGAIESSASDESHPATAGAGDGLPNVSPVRMGVETMAQRRVHTPTDERVQVLGGRRFLLPEVLRCGDDEIDMAGLYSIAEDHAPRAHVLVEGETGTGKESLIAGLFEMAGVDPGKRIMQDCSALAPDIAESELFGHEKGAFTGAHEKRTGLLKQCDGGAIFLDELGKLDNGLQQKLQRFMQEGEIRAAGSNRMQRLQVRVFAGTNVDVERVLAPDLLARFVYHLVLPSLRERRRDLLWLLAEPGFLGCGDPFTGITLRALCCLFSYGWPKNIRELENECRRWKRLRTDSCPLGSHIADRDAFKGVRADAWAAFAKYALAAWEKGEAARGWDSDAAAVAMAGLLLAIVDGEDVWSAPVACLPLDGLQGWLENGSPRFAVSVLWRVLCAENRVFNVGGAHAAAQGCSRECDLGDTLGELAEVFHAFLDLDPKEREEPVASEAKRRALRTRPKQPSRAFVERMRSTAGHVPLWKMPEPPPGKSELERLLDEHGIKGEDREACLLCAHGLSNRQIAETPGITMKRNTVRDHLADFRRDYPKLAPLIQPQGRPGPRRQD